MAMIVYESQFRKTVQVSLPPSEESFERLICEVEFWEVFF